MTKQPDLLEWAPPTATLIAFPQDRNVGKARHVAAIYISKPTDRARRSYWRTATDNLDAAMKRAGLDDAERQKQFHLFKRAVEIELVRLDRRDHQPGGAA